jgi:hypothetical protein
MLMRKVTLIAMLIILQLVITGCNSESEFQKEKTTLTKQIESLTEKNQQMENRISVLEGNQAKISFLEMELQYSTYLTEAYKNNLKNIFHPSLLKTGDEIAGLQVGQIRENPKGKEVLFEGEFKVKLKISQDTQHQYSEPTYVFEVVKSYDKTVAKDIFTYSKKMPMTYDLGDSSKTLMNEISKVYKEGIEVTVILDNYSISYDYSNFVNRARFIKLISID